MDEFPSLLARDFGFKPQGKSAPMAPSRANNSSFVLGSNASEFPKSSSLRSTAVFDDHDRDGPFFNDVFVGPPKYSSTSAVDSRSGNASSFDYGSLSDSSNANSMPVYDKPVYDDDVDIFKGLPGLRTSSTPAAAASSSGAKFDDVFASFSRSSAKHESARESSPLDDLLGNLGKKETESRVKSEKDVSAFDDLLPGFGRSRSPSSNRSTSESSQSQKPPSNSTKTASSVMEDPFGVSESTSTHVGSSSEVFTDRLEEIGKFGGSGSAKVNGSSVSGGVFDDLDSLNILGKSVPPVSPEINKRGNDRSLRSKSVSGTQTHPRKESIDRSSVENFDGYAQNNTPVDNFQGSNDTLFDMPSVATDSSRSAGSATSPPSYMSATDSLRSAGRATSPPSYMSATDSLRSAGRATSPPSYMSATDSLRSAGRATSPPSYTSASPSETNSQVNTTPKSEDLFDSAEDVWLTVSEIPLFTQPTSAPPPSRPPPPRPTRVSKLETGNARKKANEYSSFSNSPQCTHSPKSTRAGTRSSAASQIDELEDFAMSRSWNNVNEYGEVPSAEDVESSIAAASAAAMKEAMDRAEAKFRHAKEMRERESFKAARSRESVQPDREERATQQDAQERLDREMQQREKGEEQRRLEREREREREEKEREKKRIEKEKERAREIEKEREKARQAVERATREARERAAAEARLKAERAAVDKANAAARERAERAAVQRAQAEARERAAAEARERAERAAAEARERANAEAREKEARERASVARTEAEALQRAERAAVQRAASEARERAAAEARERAAAAARANQNQQKNDNDLESFFSMSSRPSSAPRPRANTSDSLFDSQSKGGPEPARRTSVGASSNMRKASSTTNIVDDLSSIFGAAGSSAGEFQDVEGETEERRRARLERHQRTQERAAKALAEKNERDLQAQRDQAERHRIAETLDVEIKRWAAGKEGNIRALLATMQYVLWPESGWQPVSLTDLITAAAVKKCYRKATLCIHPDKVQQKGANLQQKYIAEKLIRGRLRGPFTYAKMPLSKYLRAILLL
ncbi:auxilin-related protein 2 [Citrus sinensis]|uniref:Auxilin-related protein 2 n=1 Tax=Citrus sinensis TaxID=2711 RepID=A0ACB8N805_CITSI|nr:auxilin-related protein 2 [Citrus sinensis]